MDPWTHTGPPPAAQDRVRRRVSVRGLVQGVGFRPFTHRLAHRHGCAGWVRNDGDGVVIEVEGTRTAVDRFVADLAAAPPERARVEGIAAVPLAPTGAGDFRIVESAPSGPAGARIAADAATCVQCLGELMDPNDRRHRHPFISCISCGPRFTIVTRPPYDRARTTMAGFAMCRECHAEYTDPGGRRFHAETIACHECGPQLSMTLAEACAVVDGGGILAVKGLGGWHLACDARSEEAVARLRTRKRRDDKPFAVMAADPQALAQLAPDEQALLQGPVAPIVLARRRDGADVAPSVAPATSWIGLLMPYTPVHHLLLADLARPLVMTSGNRSDEPIAVDDEEALTRLAGIADAFLGHDRPIRHRAEDSVVRREHVVRRSRGMVPEPLPLPVPAARTIVAAGADLKGAVCVARGSEAVLSSHLGDRGHPEAERAFRDELALLLSTLGRGAEVVACDMHPGYRSSAWAREQEAEIVEVQHHHAHAAACLAEHGEEGPALAVVLDGTGYGTDGTLWGGEVLRADLAGFERVAHLDPVPLPGGEAAIREPWRMCAAYLEAAGRSVPFPRWETVRQSLRVNAPLSSGAGRLLDAVAALLGVREQVTYEGQAAIELEHLAGEAAAAPYGCARVGMRIRGADLVGQAADDLADGRERAEIAAAVHEGLALAMAEACADADEPRLVVLSGGCLLNLRLARSLERLLTESGFRVLTHRRVPPGDGGIGYGQAAVAARRVAPCA